MNAKALKLSDVQTLETLIEFVCVNSGRKPKLPLQRKLKTNISTGKRLDDETQSRLVSLVENDDSLSVHRHLLIISCDIRDWDIEEEIRKIVVCALKSHYLFSEEKFQELFDRGSRPFVQSNILSELGEKFEKHSLEKSDLVLLKPRERDVLQENATYCLALLFRFNTGVEEASRLRTLCKEAYVALWATRAREINSDAAKMAALVDQKPLALGIACEAFYEEEKRYREYAKKTEVQEQSVREKNDELIKANEGLVNRLKVLEDEINQTKALMDSKEREYELQLTKQEKEFGERISIGNNELSRFKARVRKRFKSDIALLEDALHANRKNPPSTNVVDDHIDRVSQALKGEVIRIDGEG